MSIIRVNKNKNNPYVQLDKRAIQDEELSWKAKGILAYFLSLPDDWKIYTSELVKHAPDGEASLRSGMKELEEKGYLVKEQKRSDSGEFGGYDYVVYEHPAVLRKSPYGDENTENNSLNNQPYCGFPNVENPNVENPDVENRRLLINNNTNNDLNKNDLTNIKCVGKTDLAKPKCDDPFQDIPEQPIGIDLRGDPAETDERLLSKFEAVTKILRPIELRDPYQLAKWIKEVGKWTDMGATEADITVGVEQADQRGTTLSWPGSITSYLKSAIARRERGVDGNPKKKPGGKQPKKAISPEDYKKSWLADRVETEAL